MVVTGLLITSMVYMSTEQPVFSGTVWLEREQPEVGFELPEGRFTIWLEVLKNYPSDPASYVLRIESRREELEVVTADRLETREFEGLDCFLLGTVTVVPEGEVTVTIQPLEGPIGTPPHSQFLYLMRTLDPGWTPVRLSAPLFMAAGMALVIFRTVHPPPVEEERDPRDHGEEPELEEGSPVVRRRPGDPV